MAYIVEPKNTRIYLFKDVPLDKDYNHTFYQEEKTTLGASQAAQFDFFTDNFAGYKTLPINSYQRVDNGVIRVAFTADELYHYNYMAFCNNDPDPSIPGISNSFSRKWFYCFINNVEFVNNNTSNIHYTIDEMQTWYFDYDFGDCFIDRQHTIYDDYEGNLVPENIDVGKLVPIKKEAYLYPEDSNEGGTRFTCVVLYVPNNTKKFISGVSGEGYTTTDCYDNTTHLYNTGMVINGVYMGCKYWGVSMDLHNNTAVNTTRARIDNLINFILGDEIGGSIVGMMQVPTAIYNEWVNNIVISSDTKTMKMIDSFKSADGSKSYVPKNRKLYSYPYRQIVVTNNAGQSAEYRWENFSTIDTTETTDNGKRIATFNIEGVPLITTEIMCYPTDHRNLVRDYDSAVVLNDLPQPAWNEDSFTKWWTQNGEAYLLGLLGSAILLAGSIVATVATAGAAAPAAAGSGALLTGAAMSATAMTAAGAGARVMNQLGTLSTASNTPDQMNGLASTPCLRVAQNRIGFYFYDMGVEYDRAKTIDNYFSMFGYACKYLDKPNIKRVQKEDLRPCWNYIKTEACVIHPASGSGLPSNSEKIITEVFNKGITFWMDKNVGNYSRNNPGKINHW